MGLVSPPGADALSTLLVAPLPAPSLVRKCEPRVWVKEKGVCGPEWEEGDGAAWNVALQAEAISGAFIV